MTTSPHPPIAPKPPAAAPSPIRRPAADPPELEPALVLGAILRLEGGKARGPRGGPAWLPLVSDGSLVVRFSRRGDALIDAQIRQLGDVLAATLLERDDPATAELWRRADRALARLPEHKGDSHGS